MQMHRVLFELGVDVPRFGGYINKSFDPEEAYSAKVGDKAKNIRRFQISDGDEDRHGHKVLVDGWVFKNYKMNPQVQYNHRGNCTGNPDHVVGSGNVKKNGNVILGDALFDVMGEGVYENAIAKKVLYKLDNGFLSSSSVSIFPLQWRFGDKDMGESPEQFIFVKHELLEFSVVDVPANARANMVGSKGFVDAVRKMEEVLNNEGKDFKNIITSEEQEIESDHMRIENIKRLVEVHQAKLRLLM